MSLNFDGVEYRTIADVKDKYHVSEKSLKRWIAAGYLSSPQIESHGGRTFRIYTDEWCVKLAEFLEKKKMNGK